MKGSVVTLLQTIHNVLNLGLLLLRIIPYLFLVVVLRVLSKVLEELLCEVLPPLAVYLVLFHIFAHFLK